MPFKNINEALAYLRKLDMIIIPTQFTYFNHCTSYQNEAIQAKQVIKKSWTEIPTDEFTIKREMSFVERTERMEEALGYGSVTKAQIKYALPYGAKPFIIRVIMPKRRLSDEDKENLRIDDEYQAELEKCYIGGDYRHPKLRNGEQIFIFGSSTIDEISGQHIDILYGIRKTDVIRYAERVFSCLKEKNNYPEVSLPEAVQVPGHLFYEWNHDYQFDRETYMIPKSQSMRRYKRYDVLDSNLNRQAYQLSEFEQEYFEELKKIYSNSVPKEYTSKRYK